MTIHLFSASFIGEEIVNLIKDSGPVATVVLVILLAFSVLSWGIILSKWARFGNARRQSGRFVRAFRKSQRLQDIAAAVEQFRPSPLVAVFEGGYEEYRRQVSNSGGVVRSLDSIRRAMQIASSEELTRMERRMP